MVRIDWPRTWTAPHTHMQSGRSTVTGYGHVTGEDSMAPTSSTLVAAMLAAILALATGASTASGQDEVKDNPKGPGSDEFVTRLFAGKIGQKNSYACFSREYDAAHLASHKLQKVAAM